MFTLCSGVLLFKYFAFYKEGVSQEWSDAPPEAQSSQYSQFMTRMAFISILNLLLNKGRDIVFQKTKRVICKDVHRVTLRSVLFAPVNTFFDVTPLGKIV